MKVNKLLESSENFQFSDEVLKNKYLYNRVLELQSELIEQLECKVVIKKVAQYYYELNVLKIPKEINLLEIPFCKLTIGLFSKSLQIEAAVYESSKIDNRIFFNLSITFINETTGILHSNGESISHLNNGISISSFTAGIVYLVKTMKNDIYSLTAYR